MALEKEFKYYRDHQDELVAKYAGKVIVIKDEQILGAYDSDTEAVLETQQHHKPGTFLVQLCTPGNRDYTQTFHSRVVFV